MAFNLLDRKRKFRQSYLKKKILKAVFVISTSIIKALRDNGLSVTESEHTDLAVISFTKCWSGYR